MHACLPHRIAVSIIRVGYPTISNVPLTGIHSFAFDVKPRLR
jgi:hypothetical protein